MSLDHSTHEHIVQCGEGIRTTLAFIEQRKIHDGGCLSTAALRLVSAEPRTSLFVYLLILALLIFEQIHKIYFDD